MPRNTPPQTAHLGAEKSTARTSTGSWARFPGRQAGLEAVGGRRGQAARPASRAHDTYPVPLRPCPAMPVLAALVPCSPPGSLPQRGLQGAGARRGAARGQRRRGARGPGRRAASLGWAWRAPVLAISCFSSPPAPPPPISPHARPPPIYHAHAFTSCLAARLAAAGGRGRSRWPEIEQKETEFGRRAAAAEHVGQPRPTRKAREFEREKGLPPRPHALLTYKRASALEAELGELHLGRWGRRQQTDWGLSGGKFQRGNESHAD